MAKRLTVTPPPQHQVLLSLLAGEHLVGVVVGVMGTVADLGVAVLAKLHVVVAHVDLVLHVVLEGKGLHVVVYVHSKTMRLIHARN